MCWMTYNTACKDRKVAEHDIPVFKVVMRSGDKFSSIYQSAVYETGQDYTSDMDEPFHRDGHYCLTAGLHSYDVSSVTTSRYDFTYPHIRVVGRHGYSLDNFGIFDRSITLYRLDCVIPKGASYYLNDQGEYVSDRIRVLSSQQI